MRSWWLQQRENVEALRKAGVRNVGLAPRGRAEWPVKGAAKQKLIRERTLVEGGIGAMKSLRYGFHRPGEVDGDDGRVRAARSARLQPKHADPRVAAAANAAATRQMITRSEFGFRQRNSPSSRSDESRPRLRVR